MTDLGAADGPAATISYRFALRARHVPGRTAAFAAQAAVAVFTAAYDDWADDTTADFTALMQRSLSDLRHAICPPQADLHLPHRPGFAVSAAFATRVLCLPTAGEQPP